MSQVYQTAFVSLPCAAEAIHEGYIYKSSGATTYRMTATTAINSTAVAVAMSSSMDVQTGTARTLAAGDEWQFALMDSAQIVNVAFVASRSLTPFAPVYLSSTTGLATEAHATSRPIGHLMIKAAVTSTDGGLYPVLLDQSIGATLVA